MAWLEVLHTDLVFLSLVVDIPMLGHLWPLLVLEEGVMQDLIVNINFAHFWLHSLSHLLLERLRLVSLRRLLSQFRYAGLFDKVWQLEGNFVDSSLILKIASFLCPVSRNGN